MRQIKTRLLISSSKIVYSIGCSSCFLQFSVVLPFLFAYVPLFLSKIKNKDKVADFRLFYSFCQLCLVFGVFFPFYACCSLCWTTESCWTLGLISRKQTQLKKKKKICKTKCNILNLVTNIHSKLLINRNAPMNRTPNNFLHLRYCSYENSNTLIRRK